MEQELMKWNILQLRISILKIFPVPCSSASLSPNSFLEHFRLILYANVWHSVPNIISGPFI